MSIISKLFPPKENTISLAIMLVKIFKIDITISSIVGAIEEHPNYPSLLSLSDVLNNYGIYNVTAQFPIQQIPSLPTPLIIQLKSDFVGEQENEFTIVREVRGNDVEIYDFPKARWKIISLNELHNICSGIAMLIDYDNRSGEKDYRQKLRNEKYGVLLQNISILFLPFLLLLMCGVVYYRTGASVVSQIFYSLLTFIGLVFSSLLLWSEVDEYNPALRKICTPSKKINCAAVVSSEGGKLFGLVSWSIIGTVYFAGTILVLLIKGINDKSLFGILSWLTVPVAGFILYSLYYQWRIVKQWCMLCLFVQATLFLQLMTVVFKNNWYFSFAEFSGLFLELITSYGVIFLALALIFPLIKRNKELKLSKQEFQRFKHDSSIFNSILVKGKQITENSITGLGITLGNPAGKFKLVKVCNPYCGPCGAAHRPIEELLYNNPELQVRIIYHVRNSPSDLSSFPVLHFLAMQKNYDPKDFAIALDDWYSSERKDYSSYAEKYKLDNVDLENFRPMVAKMEAWCSSEKISYTPTFFVQRIEDENDQSYFELSQNYSVQDLKYYFSV